jgi:membrane associated rhomboid family serine protease
MHPGWVSCRHHVCVIRLQRLAGRADRSKHVMTDHPRGVHARCMPLTDGMPARRFPIVNVLLIAANFIVWIFYELPHLDKAVAHSSFYACDVSGACHAPLPWAVSWFTAMFMHASWGHLLGNMWFLAIFGKNVEDAFGRLRYLLLYVAGGFVAAATQAAMTLIAGSTADAMAPMLGASGAIAAVLGAYWVLYPDSKILALVVVFPIRIRASVFLGLWFLYQLVMANAGLTGTGSQNGGTAFFAHVGGFVFGVLVAVALAKSGQRQDQRVQRSRFGHGARPITQNL